MKEVKVYNTLNVNPDLKKRFIECKPYGFTTSKFLNLLLDIYENIEETGIKSYVEEIK